MICLLSGFLLKTPEKRKATMIIDRLSNSHLYQHLGTRIQSAFNYLRNTDLAGLPVGKVEIDGKALYISVQEYKTKLPAQGRWEAHRAYIDLQIVIHGMERIGYSHLSRLQPGDYDEAKDVMFLEGREDNLLLMQPGDFMILWPEDAHMPCMAVDQPTQVKKAVVKIAV